VSDYEAAVLAVLGRLEPGEVVTYGEVATEAGFPGAPRAVAGVLNRHPGLPWWRVVNAAGRLAPGKEAEQGRRLRAEGVPVVDGARVRMARGRAAGMAGGRRRGAPPPPRV
jgi:methylated-DNA-protein-cysteine methyltransferase-like protein